MPAKKKTVLGSRKGVKPAKLKGTASKSAKKNKQEVSSRPKKVSAQKSDRGSGSFQVGSGSKSKLKPSAAKTGTQTKKKMAKKAKLGVKATIAAQDESSSRIAALGIDKEKAHHQAVPDKSPVSKKSTRQTKQAKKAINLLKGTDKTSSKGASDSKPSRAKAESVEKLGKLAQKWMTLYRRAKNVKAVPYSMRAQYEAKTAIQHKVLGWGYILANKNDRLEVLFKDGVRYLISNYR
ncbi:MAG: hypothetical protein KDD35_06600 [Bdellovibrionales bacterium]|nr:hypothetical protein [Bdellovibrionales bacterium]